MAMNSARTLNRTDPVHTVQCICPQLFNVPCIDDCRELNRCVIGGQLANSGKVCTGAANQQRGLMHYIQYITSNTLHCTSTPSSSIRGTLPHIKEYILQLGRVWPEQTKSPYQVANQTYSLHTMILVIVAVNLLHIMR